MLSCLKINPFQNFFSHNKLEEADLESGNFVSSNQSDSEEMAIQDNVIKSDETDSDDNSSEGSSEKKKRPSTGKVLALIGVTSGVTMGAMYCKLSPVITVMLAQQVATASKALLRRLPRIKRYIFLTGLVGSCVVLDHVIKEQTNENLFDLAAISGGIALACLGRTQKLFITGNLYKD